MQVIVSGQNLPMTEALKDYAQKKIGKIEHYFAEAMVNGKVEMRHHQTKSPDKQNEASVMLNVHGAIISAREINADMYAAIDLLFEKLEKQIKKYKDKMKNHKAEKTAVAIDNIDNADQRYSTKGAPVVYTNRQALKPMDVEEAVLQLQISGMEFLVFRNDKTNLLNVIYKMHEGDFGLIESDN